MKYFLAGLVALAILVLLAVRILRGRIQGASGEAAAAGVSETERAASEESSAEGAAGSRKTADIDALSITLDVNDKPSLYVMLAADGTINRMGSGTWENSGGGLFIGKIDPAVFEAARVQVSEAILGLVGQTFQHQNPRGAPCKLSLNFHFKDGSSNGLAFLYGSESEGVPKEVADYVTAVVRATASWYEKFKRTSAEKQL